MRTNCGARLTEYEIAAKVTQAFTRIRRLNIAKFEFQCTGILPLNAGCVSTAFNFNEKDNIETKPSTSKVIVSVIHQFSPVPNAAEKRVMCRRRKPEKSDVLISSPTERRLLKIKLQRLSLSWFKCENLKARKLTTRQK